MVLNVLKHSLDIACSRGLCNLDFSFSGVSFLDSWKAYRRRNLEPSGVKRADLALPGGQRQETAVAISDLEPLQS